MATSSTKKLTKYTSGSTIVTADTANAWYGGLYGSYEGTLLDADDPRVIGHVHDGEPYDGHSAKINLVSHVTDKLQHQNLADEAVWKNNVGSFLDQTQAIPESYTIGSDKYYFLDLTDVYTYVDDEIAGINSPFEEADSNADTVDDVVRQSDLNYSSSGLDFVFGSAKLDDMNDGGKGDNRILFDRSKAAFRAGSTDSTDWDNSNRGNYSAALGLNNKASGTSSFAIGEKNIASATNTFAGGSVNIVGGNNSASFGKSNSITTQNSFASGDGNTLTSGSDHSAAFGVGNASVGLASLVFGKYAAGKVDGELVHASGSFTSPGDAQTSEYVVRGSILNPTMAPGISLSIDGIGSNYQMDVGAAYNISVSLVGKLSIAAPLPQEAGAYKLESLGIGPILIPPTPGTVSAPIITYISRTPYFLGLVVNATLQVNPANSSIRIRVSDSHVFPNFYPSNWVATVRLTKCEF
jgi:hypothetical protein